MARYYFYVSIKKISIYIDDILTLCYYLCCIVLIFYLFVTVRLKRSVKILIEAFRRSRFFLIGKNVLQRVYAR